MCLSPGNRGTRSDEVAAPVWFGNLARLQSTDLSTFHTRNKNVCSGWGRGGVYWTMFLRHHPLRLPPTPCPQVICKPCFHSASCDHSQQPMEWRRVIISIAVREQFSSLNHISPTIPQKQPKWRVCFLKETSAEYLGWVDIFF